jgi:hypothetical protein
MMVLIWSTVKARIVFERTPPRNPIWSRAAVAVSSSGYSEMATSSYSPTI